MTKRRPLSRARFARYAPDLAQHGDGGAIRKRAGYREQVAWIADNDDPGAIDALDVEAVRVFVTVAMVADTWNKTPLDVAADVVRVRKRSERDPKKKNVKRS